MSDVSNEQITIAEVHMDSRKIAYTLNEAAEAIGVSVPTMQKFVHMKGFPALRAGRKYVIPIEAFQRWMEERAAGRADDAM